MSDTDTERVVFLSNKLIERFRLEKFPVIDKIEDISPYFLCLLFESATKIKFTARPLTTKEDQELCVYEMLRILQLEVLQISLSHIVASEVVKKKARALVDFLEILEFCGNDGGSRASEVTSSSASTSDAGVTLTSVSTDTPDTMSAISSSADQSENSDVPCALCAFLAQWVGPDWKNEHVCSSRTKMNNNRGTVESRPTAAPLHRRPYTGSSFSPRPRPYPVPRSRNGRSLTTRRRGLAPPLLPQQPIDDVKLQLRKFLEDALKQKLESDEAVRAAESKRFSQTTGSVPPTMQTSEKPRTSSLSRKPSGSSSSRSPRRKSPTKTTKPKAVITSTEQEPPKASTSTQPPLPTLPEVSHETSSSSQSKVTPPSATEAPPTNGATPLRSSIVDAPPTATETGEGGCGLGEYIISPHTDRVMEEQFRRHLNFLTANSTEATLEQLQKRYDDVVGAHAQRIIQMRKELCEQQRVLQEREERNVRNTVANLERDRRAETAKLRNLKSQQEQFIRSRELRVRHAEEMALKQAFQEAMRLQRRDVLEINRMLREERLRDRTKHQIHLASLENFYQTQLCLLQETLSKEKSDAKLRSTAQTQFLEKLRQEFSKKLREEIDVLHDIMANEERR